MATCLVVATVMGAWDEPRTVVNTTLFVLPFSVVAALICPAMRWFWAVVLGGAVAGVSVGWLIFFAMSNI